MESDSRAKAMRDLESLVFGDDAIDTKLGSEAKQALAAPQEAKAFVIDKRGDRKRNRPADRKRRAAAAEAAPAWEDDDDAQVQADLRGAARARKLRETEEEGVVGGKEYEARLRKQFVKLHGAAAWAQEGGDGAARAHDDSEEDEDDEVDGVLRSTASLLAGKGGQAEGLPLTPGVLNIQRAKNVNQAGTSKAVVRSVRFHSSGGLALTAGLDKTLRIFQVDGDANAMVHSVHFTDLPITCAEFVAAGGRDEVVCVGRRPFFYTFDMHTGQASRIARIETRTEKSLETMVASPCGRRLCILGNDGALILLCARTKRWEASLKMNGAVRCAAFSHDGDELLAAGVEGQVYRWDLRTRRCLHRHADEGSTRSTAIAMCPTGRYYAVGADSGVVNIYDARGDAMLRGDPTPSPVKALMGLTTRVDELRYSSDGAILATASQMKRGALKLVHTDTHTTFHNWPTERTPLGYAWSVAFSPNSGYFSVGNDKGKALLWRLPHYSRA